MSPSQRAFETHAAEYESQLQQGLSLSGESKAYFARGRLDHLRSWWDLTHRREPSRILDYGCGMGDVTALLAETFPGAAVIGADPSEQLIESARTAFSDRRVSFVRLDGFGAPAGDPYDLVHVNGVIHHVPEPQRPLLYAALYDAVAPSGVAAVFENNPLNPGTRAVMRRIPFDRGCAPVSARSVRAGLERAGLRVVRTRFLFWFPRPLRGLRPLEPHLDRIPLGAQYGVLAERDRDR